MQMILTGLGRVSLEKWLTFPPTKDSPYRWLGLSSQSLWSVLFLECLGHWRHQLRSHTEEATQLGAGPPEMTVFRRHAGGRKWLSLVGPLCWPLGVASIKEGVAEDVKEAKSVLNFFSGNPISWSISYLLFPFRSLALSQTILWWDGRGWCTAVIT